LPDHGGVTDPYGQAHKQRRVRAIRQLQPGEPCPECGLPMYATAGQAAAAGAPAWAGTLHLDHLVPLALGGAPGGAVRLVHGRCNTSRTGAIGARITNSRRRARARRVRYDRW
jgi:hypothetical protein